jgi:uncharacterized protein
VLVDANILIYAVDTTSPFHTKARAWLEEALNGPRRVALAWPSLHAFLRISTNARAMSAPLDPSQAWTLVERWLDAPATWVPSMGDGHRELLGRLIVAGDLRGNLISDAVLAALCLEHGLMIVSADSDFARFPSIVWFNPVAAA